MKHPPHENYWDMSPEQEKYYTDQFLSLQSDLSGLVSYITIDINEVITDCFISDSVINEWDINCLIGERCGCERIFRKE